MFAPAESGCAWSEQSRAEAYWAARVATWASARHTTSDSDHRVPVSRAQDDPDPETRSAEEGRQRPRELRGIVEPGKAPGAGLHRQLGMLEETGMLGGVPRRQPGVVLIGEQQHRLPRSAC